MKRVVLKLALMIVAGLFITSCEEPEINPIDENTEATETVTRASNLRTDPLSVVVNGVPLSWPDDRAKPAIVNSRSMVYFRTIFERLGFNVTWQPTDPNPTSPQHVGRQYVKAVNRLSGRTIELWIGLTEARVNGTTVFAAVAPYNNQGYVMVHSAFIGEHSGVPTEWDNQTRSVQMYYYDENDYGFYFYDEQPEPNGNPTADAVGNRKFAPGRTLDTRFFDPNKPTIIYVHGFQPDGVVNRSRESFLMDFGGQNTQSHNVWKQQGWNVAIFHWINMADDRQINFRPWAAEAKIYDADNTVNGMRWRRTNGTYEEALVPRRSLRQLFADEFQKVFNSNYNGAEIRIVGNSLGGNLTIAASQELLDRNSSRMPSRITLMDPYWSLSNRSTDIGFDQGLAENFAGIAAQNLANTGIAIEYFRTSALGQEGFSRSAADVAAYSQLTPTYAVGANPVETAILRHTRPVRGYFHSRNQVAPAEFVKPNLWSAEQATGNTGASAAVSNARVRQMMGDDHTWVQFGGGNTSTMGDDDMRRENGTKG